MESLKCETGQKSADAAVDATSPAKAVDTALPENGAAEEEAVKDEVVKEGGAKKKKKKKSGAKGGVTLSSIVYEEIEGLDNGRWRHLGDWKNVKGETRLSPKYDVGIKFCYKKGDFPLGEIISYGEARVTGEEERERERAETVNYDDLRRAAEAHRQTRKHIQQWIKPGMTTLEIVKELESTSKRLIDADGLQAGWAFPTGISINECAAHYTPNYSDTVIPKVTKDDITKIDFGLHVGGRLVDCAFTLAFDEKFDPLVQSTVDATNAGIKAAGVDARFEEVGAAIQEVIESFEITLNGKTIPIKPIANLNGHTTAPYRVHAGKSLPIVRVPGHPDFMEEGEVYAIETFASTGRGHVVEDGDCSHFMLDADWRHNDASRRQQVPYSASPTVKLALDTILREYDTLAFCRRWLDDAGCKRHIIALNALVKANIVNAYPPLVDIKGSFTSQMEHTVILRPTCKEVVTRGDDY